MNAKHGMMLLIGAIVRTMRALTKARMPSPHVRAVVRAPFVTFP